MQPVPGSPTAGRAWLLGTAFRAPSWAVTRPQWGQNQSPQPRAAQCVAKTWALRGRVRCDPAACARWSQVAGSGLRDPSRDLYRGREGGDSLKILCGGYPSHQVTVPILHVRKWLARGCSCQCFWDLCQVGHLQMCETGLVWHTGLTDPRMSQRLLSVSPSTT